MPETGELVRAFAFDQDRVHVVCRIHNGGYAGCGADERQRRIDDMNRTAAALLPVSDTPD